tara:strand:- start:2980 stop:3876 length:897 start_codon:yes stop_codon:yes gene_type:complete
MNEIPRISYIDLKNNNSISINMLKEALHAHGFFAIYDHNIDKELINNCYKIAKEFFELDIDIKNRHAYPNIGGARGYTPFGKETALGEIVPDLKEFWHHGPEVDSTYDSRINKNIQIKEIDNFNIIFDNLFSELNTLGIKLLESIAKTIDLNENFFSSSVIKGNSLLRMIHYPPSDNKNIFRAREHCDINFITLLIGANEKGLEIKSKDKSWIKVSANKDDIVCNIGDMLQLVTSGNLKSTPHRVIKYTDEKSSSRYSIPFFLHPSPDTILKSIYDDSDKGILAHDFLEERLKAIKLY